MGQALVTLPDGKKARITFDTQAQLDATIDDLTAPKEPGHPISDAFAETGLHLATGAAAGLAGGLNYLGTLVATQDPQAAKAVQEQTQEKLTYQPKTKGGKAVTEGISKPFQWLADTANVAGEKVAEVTHSPALGAATNVALQAAPSVVLPASRALMRAGRGAAAGTAAGTGAAEELSTTSAPRTPPTDVGGGDVSRETPAGGTPPAETPGAAQPQALGGSSPPNPTEAAARAYASRIGLDWTRLGTGTRSALQTIAQDSHALDRLDPAAVRRQAHLESLRIPVKATRGQLTLDPAQLRREAIAARTDQGQPIQDTDVAANRDIQANLEVLRGRVGGLKGGLHPHLNEEGQPAAAPSIREPTKLPTQVGESAQQALREKAKWSKKGYDALYKIARDTEPTAEAGLKPVTDLLTENPDIQHLGWVKSWLNKAAGAKAAQMKAAGEEIPEGGVHLEKATLNELDDLRKLAQKHGQGTDAHYAAELRKAVDAAMDDVPAGSKAWKAARDAFRAHQREFKDQGLVQKLVSTKKASGDRALALEKTWKTLSQGPLEQLKAAKTSLLTGGTAATRMSGRRAWRDLRAETVNRILEDARNVTSTDKAERAILTAAALRKSINRIPRENLEELIGKRNVRELNDILRAREITRGRTTESGTVPNILVLAEKLLGHIPLGIGTVAKGAIRGGKKLHEMGAAGRDTEQALRTPLEEAAREAARSRPARRARDEAFYRELEGSGATLPPGSPQPVAPVQPGAPLSTDLSIGSALKNRQLPP